MQICDLVSSTLTDIHDEYGSPYYATRRPHPNIYQLTEL